MIELLIFHFHILAALYAFTRRWQEANAREGFLAVVLIGLVFLVLWTVSGTLAKFLPAAVLTEWFTRDTFSLLLLVLPEYFFFRIFFLNRKQENVEAAAA